MLARTTFINVSPGVVKRIRKHKLKSCTALIWSMCHVVIVIVNDDLVQHSPVFPLIAAFRVDDHRLEVTLRVLASYLSPIQELIAGGTARRLAFQTPRLPAEMVSHIMGFMDHSSYYRMRHVCWATRHGMHQAAFYWTIPRLQSRRRRRGGFRVHR